jgi:hypothetical protein
MTDATQGSPPQDGAGPTEAGIRRRDVLEQGAKSAFLAPLVMTFFASQALAGSQMSVISAPLCIGPGGLCIKDSNCCSNSCTGGICN